MPKAATSKTTKPAKEPKEQKEKTPSPYQMFMKERLPTYKAEHPDVTHKDAFRSVALEWKDSDSNPNKGKVIEPKPPRVKKDKAEPKPKAAKKKPAKKAAASSDAEDEEAGDDDESA